MRLQNRHIVTHPSNYGHKHVSGFQTRVTLQAGSEYNPNIMTNKDSTCILKKRTHTYKIILTTYVHIVYACIDNIIIWTIS